MLINSTGMRVGGGFEVAEHSRHEWERGGEAYLQINGKRHDDGGHHEVGDRERSDVPERTRRNLLRRAS